MCSNILSMVLGDEPALPDHSENPAVSIIVPCYKVTAYVADALDSIRAQTFRNFETIVVNDGCPDTEGLERVLAPYSSEIVYIRQENRGVASARNAAIRAARAPIVALLDPDDVWEPDYLEAQIALLQSHPEVDVVYSDAVMFGDTRWQGDKFSDHFPLSADVTFENLVSERCIVFGPAAIRRDALLRVGLYDTAAGIAEDRDLCIRMVKAGSKFLLNPKPVYRYRLMRPGSISSDSVVLGQSVLRAYQKVLNSCALTSEEWQWVDAAIRRKTAEIDLMLGKKALYAGDYREASRRLKAASRVIHGNYKLRAAIFMVQVWPGLLSAYIHRRYPTESSYVR
jgi:glycosyltransferase involved in cell wall biosynthesis